MPKLTDQERLDKLLARRAAAEREIRRIKSRGQKQARAVDAHRKIVAGALALDHFAKNPDSEFGRTMFRLLDEYVRPDERYLFDFLPLRDAPPDSAAA